MSILRERTVWKRPPVARLYERLDRLTPEQKANVRAALRVLHVRYRTWKGVAAALRMRFNALERVMCRERRPVPGLAMRVAHVAGVPADDVLSGVWPKPGSCPMCGRGGD